MADKDTYEGPDLAALLVLLMLNARDGTQTVQLYGSFKEQIDNSRALSADPKFQRALSAIAVLQEKSPHVIEAAHMSIRALLLELEATNLWGSCKAGPPGVHPRDQQALVRRRHDLLCCCCARPSACTRRRRHAHCEASDGRGILDEKYLEKLRVCAWRLVEPLTRKTSGFPDASAWTRADDIIPDADAAARSGLRAAEELTRVAVRNEAGRAGRGA